MPNTRNNNGNDGNSKRGLASADKETRERVASAGGRASAESRREDSNRGGNSNRGNSNRNNSDDNR